MSSTTITKIQRDLETAVAKCQNELDAFRDAQKTTTRQFKNNEKKYKRLTDLAYDPKTSRGDSNAARANRDGMLGPKRIELQTKLDAYPETINLTEVKLVEAQNALREYKADPAAFLAARKPKGPTKEVQPAQKKEPFKRAAKPRTDETTFGAGVAQEMMRRTMEGSHIQINNNRRGIIPPALAARRAENERARATSLAPEPARRGRESRATPRGTPLGWQGTARPANKRTAAALDDDDEEGVRPPKRQHIEEIDEEEERALKPPKKARTDAGDRVLKEKSTNENVTAARGRLESRNAKGKKRTRQASPSPSRVKKVARTKIVVDDDSDEESAPKSAAPAKSTNTSRSAVPAADMTSGRTPTANTSTTASNINKETSSKTAGKYKVGKRTPADFKDGAKGVARTTTKGTKRTASWSVGDAVAPEAKRQKSDPKGGDDKADGEGFEKASAGDVQSKEKKASNDDLEEGEIGEDGATGKTANGGFKGIKNIGASCFSATVIQLIDAALQGHNIDRLLGELADTENFGITDELCKKVEAKMTGLPDGIARKLNDVRTAVKNASLAKDSKKVSVAKHLRKLLADLRDANGEDDISAFRFQAAVSHGDHRDRRRQVLTGDNQEDVSEYLTFVLGALQKDPRIENADDTARLFDIHTETKKRCRRLGCNYESTIEEATATQHTLTVQDEAKLSELFESSKHSVTDLDCPNCGSKSKLIASTKFTRKPANFIVAMNRVQYDKDRRAPVKNRALVDIDMHELKIEDAKYGLDAVIMHKGRTANHGHYTIFRKQGENWYKIDDSVVIKVSPEEVMDSKDGQTAMLLFKRQYR